MESDFAAPVLDEQYVELIRNQVSLNVAARDGTNVPAVTRAYGCDVSPDRRSITVFVPEAANVLLQCIQENGAVAVVCSHPRTLQTLQLKGNDATVVRATPEDATHVERWRRTFTDEIEANGYGPPFSTSLGEPARQPMKAVRFTLAAIYDQSPGPAAGRQLES